MTHFSMTIKNGITFIKFFLMLCILCFVKADGWRENVVVVYAKKCFNGLWLLICCFLVLLLFYHCWCSHKFCAVVAFLPNPTLCDLCEPRTDRHRAAGNGSPAFGRNLGFKVIMLLLLPPLSSACRRLVLQSESLIWTATLLLPCGHLMGVTRIGCGRECF